MSTDPELQRHYALLAGVGSPWEVKGVSLKLEATLLIRRAGLRERMEGQEGRPAASAVALPAPLGSPRLHTPSCVGDWRNPL